MDEEFWNNLLNNTISLFIDPEVTRRLDAGIIDSSWRLLVAQVIMNVGRPVEVRLNDEVTAVFKGTLPGATAESIGKTVSLGDLESITAVQLSAADENAAHITLLRHRGSWFISFDLRYNRGRILEYLAIVDEFIATARDALSADRPRAFVENLLAGVEHLARCLLLLHPDEVLLSKGSHNLLQTRLNQHSKFGNVDARYARLLNRLWDLRSPARYVPKTFRLENKEAEELLASAKEMRKLAEEQLPPRFQGRKSG
jgi:uncharacterized protein (UPF0332 family)